MKASLFWTGFIAVILSLFGNYFYYQSKLLEEPIFLDHYYDTTVHEGASLDFYYLANKEDLRNIQQIKFGDHYLYPIQDSMMWMESNTPTNVNTYRHHALRNVRVKVPLEEINASEMEVFYDDNTSQKTEIGRVIIGKNPAPVDSLDSRVSSSSNSHRHKDSIEVKEAVTIEKIEIPQDIQEDTAVFIQLDDGVEAETTTHDWVDNPPPGALLETISFPIELEMYDWMHVHTELNPQRASYVEFSISIHGKTADGDSFIKKVPIIDHPFIDQEKVNNIIKNRGKLDENGI